MATVTARATSLAFCPDEPETEYTFVASGDASHITEIRSDAPEWVQDLITQWAMDFSFVMNYTFH